jgi:5'-nucleotidase
MPRILVTNDDGVQSEGIHALADALRSLGEVTVVAPLGEASAIGHALTIARPLRLDQLREGLFTVDGTPTDCVNIAITRVLEASPDLVVSGINKGWNLGDDVTYSGTVAGALEGCLLGIPAIAVSLQRGPDRLAFDFDPAAAIAARIAARVLHTGLPPRTFLNVNVPSGQPHGVRVTVQARRNHVTRVTQSIDPRGRPYYWIEEGDTAWEQNPHGDYDAVKAGWVSVTPLQPDLTAHDAMAFVNGLGL